MVRNVQSQVWNRVISAHTSLRRVFRLSGHHPQKRSFPYTRLRFPTQSYLGPFPTLSQYSSSFRTLASWSHRPPVPVLTPEPDGTIPKTRSRTLFILRCSTKVVLVYR